MRFLVKKRGRISSNKIRFEITYFILHPRKENKKNSIKILGRQLVQKCIGQVHLHKFLNNFFLNTSLLITNTIQTSNIDSTYSRPYVVCTKVTSSR